jgi:outer membrane protein OmpA-like peptidoglycan-associated protein
MKYLYYLFLTLTTFSQSKVTVYFETDSHQLNLSELNKIEQTFTENKNLHVISVSGFADFRASNTYNDTLALKRAVFVSNIIKKISNNTKFTVISKGENFAQNSNLSLNRKAEIIYIENNITDKIEKTEVKTENSGLRENIKIAKVGEKLILKNLNFYDRLAVLIPESKPILSDLLAVLKENPNLKIEIQGHICCTKGTDKEEIALKRCIAIYKYLVKNGINEKRLSYYSFDAKNPIHKIPEKNEEERVDNRRVEILIVGK